MTEQLEFVNDWSELEAAIQDLDNLDRLDGLTNPVGYSSIEVIQSYVPRLLTQYANLVELSFALTEGWETYATLNAPTGLYLPDNS